MARQPNPRVRQDVVFRRKRKRFRVFAVVVLTLGLSIAAGVIFQLTTASNTTTTSTGLTADVLAQAPFAEWAHLAPAQRGTGSPTGRDMQRTPPASGKTTPSASPASLDPRTAAVAEVLSLTNQQRATAGCQPLREDGRLDQAAQQHSDDMAVHHYFDHNTPSGVTPWTRMEDLGYSDPSAENIALGQPTAQAVMAAWMASAGHRANILSCSSKAIGIGVHFGTGGPWWTQDFGYS